ncbi:MULTISPECIES: hypothetical protein [Catenuloplanes]|uniref:Uncharacterized protein n=1 Tax=Catenuloplanes niger TaxID=587534 RepID=A0AAE3ZU31_9ACTN|nr:hypothetical protein [Catenuloplanes niger]MDR7325882.1 hypothetical protein [Catenuloplanes niger]
MTEPLTLTPRNMDAICLEHVMPTNTGNHIFNAPSSSMGRDGLVDEALNLPSVDRFTYVSFGLGMRSALTDTRPATTSWDGGVARPTGEVPPEVRAVRALMYQYFRGIPGEAMDRVVERPLFGKGSENVRMTLDELGARADMMGLPVEIPISRFAQPVGAHPFLANRVVFSDASGPVSRDAAIMVKVEPADRAWAENPFATVGDDVRAEALAGGYPSGRIVPVEGGKRLGTPAALAEFAHAGLLAGGRPLTPEHLTRDGVPPMITLGGYGDVLAHVAGHPDATYSLVEVRGQGAAESQVFVAVHDSAGGSYLDLGTGRAAVFPDTPELTRITTLPADLTPADLTGTGPTPAGAVPAPIVPPAGVTRTHTFGPGGSRSVDLVTGGRSGTGTVPRELEPLLGQLATAAEAIGQSVVVIGPQPRDTRYRRDPARAEKRVLLRAGDMLFQHLRNGEPAPIIFNYGGVSTALDEMAAKLGAPVIRQSMGGGLDFDRKWTATGPDGTTVVPPFKDVTRESLKSVGDLQRANADTRVEPVLGAYLSMDLSDPMALREKLRADGGALKALRPKIAALPFDAEQFRAHSKLLELLDEDTGRFDTAVHFLAATKGGDVMTLPDLPSVLRQPPETRAEALEDLKAVTYGTHDAGAARAVLDAIQKRLAGAGDDEVKKAIYDNSVYLPEGPGGRADIIRELQVWRDRATSPADRALFDEMAVWVTTCP